MRSIGYHFFEDSNIGMYKSNRASGEKPLEVNCVGFFCTESPFCTFAPVGRYDYYFMFMLSGELKLTLHQGERVCKPGDFTIIPPNTPYRYSHTEKEEINYFWLHFTGRDVDATLEELDIKCYPTVYTVESYSNIKELFNKFLSASASQAIHKGKELSILLDSLLLSCSRALSSPERMRLSKSVSFINQNFNSDIRIPDLAKMEGLSVSRYNTIFKDTMGCSPITYITRIRLTFGCELLRGTNLSISEISESVGYADAHFFSRIFKTNIGMSPNKYRKNN